MRDIGGDHPNARLGFGSVGGLTEEVNVQGGTMTAGRVMLDDGELGYERRGDGPPVVLLHGGGLSGVTWDGQVAWLERDHTVIRYDARGRGGSSPPEGPFSHHEDLRHVLDGLGVERATLVGLSLGARTAIDFALLHPDRVADLVHGSAPRAEKVLVEGAGHLVDLDRPDEFDRALLRFLSAAR
jgi:pimeloyl-ACP methyl ester carboxylesterase